MTDPLIGERMTNPPRYIDHPPAGSSLLANGRPIDAGTEMILRNNLAQLAEESLRHLVCEGQVQLQAANGSTYGWDGLTDSSGPTLIGTGQAAQGASISWDQRTACSFGPFNLIADHTISASDGALTGAAGALTIRKIRVRVEANFTHPSDTLLIALTMGEGQTPADGVIGGCFVTVPALATGTKFLQADLVCSIPAESLTLTHAPCRPSLAPVSGSPVRSIYDANIPMGFIWVGRSSVGYAADAITIYSVSAWEIL